MVSRDTLAIRRIDLHSAGPCMVLYIRISLRFPICGTKPGGSANVTSPVTKPKPRQSALHNSPKYTVLRALGIAHVSDPCPLALKDIINTRQLMIGKSEHLPQYWVLFRKLEEALPARDVHTEVTDPLRHLHQAAAQKGMVHLHADCYPTVL